MGRYTTAARVWVVLSSAAAALLTIGTLRASEIQPEAAIVFSILAACGIFAHRFPIKSIFDGASIRLTNVFILAAAVLLSPWMVALLPLVVITPDTLRNRRNPGALIRWSFNVSQTILAGLAANLWFRWTVTGVENEVFYLGIMVLTSLVFSAVQAVMVGIVIALNTKTPLRQADTFTLSHLQSSVLISLLGSLVGGLWMAKPALLVLVLPLIVLAYYLSRSAHLSHLAQIDTKTGLHNYRHFEGRLEEELCRTHRLGRPLSVVFFDMDLLRNVNNTYGHLAGDKVLQSMGQILTQTMRKGDVIARFGGEEFVALMPGTDAEEATHMAERVREAVANHAFDIEANKTIHCTVSIGVAACPEDASDVAGLIKQADLAMYRAKQTRNAVCRVRVLPSVPRVSVAPGVASQPPAAKPVISPWAAIALGGTVAAGLAVSLLSFYQQFQFSAWAITLPFMALAGATEIMKVRVFEAKHEQITMSFAIGATMAAITVNPSGAALVSLSAAVVMVLFAKKPMTLEKLLFNLSNPALAAAAAAGVFTLLNSIGNPLSFQYLAGAVVAVLAFHAVNFGMINVMISLHTGRPLLTLLSSTAWYSPTKLFLGLTGAFLGGVFSLLGVIGVIMFMVPLAILQYTIGLYAKRSETTIAELRAAKDEVEQSHLKQEQTLRQLIETVAHIVDARDHEVSGHSQRVAKYSLALAQELSLTPSELALVQTAGLLHDLGKIAVSETILNKPARLSAEEYELVKNHPGVGERILSEVGPLGEVARIVGEHHEHWNGQGYPRGKAGGEITVGGRIVAVADCLDTILSDRPYKINKGIDWALNEVKRCSGTQFDPAVVAALQRIYKAHGPEFFGQPARPEELNQRADMVS